MRGKTPKFDSIGTQRGNGNELSYQSSMHNVSPYVFLQAEACVRCLVNLMPRALSGYGVERLLGQAKSRGRVLA